MLLMQLGSADSGSASQRAGQFQPGGLPVAWAHEPPRRRSRSLAGASLAAAALLAGCGDAGWQRLGGATMGTTWRVQAHCPAPVAPAFIGAELERIDASMSHWREDSEISRFNATPVGTWVTLSPPLATVLRASLTLSAQSGGAFDVTVGALANAWGFGPSPSGVPAPAEALTAAREQVGFRRLELLGERLRKTGDVHIDLSAIAKGYAVDALAHALGQRGCNDYLVEIGGEVRASGERRRGGPWRVAIEQPNPAKRAPHRVLALADAAIATSGDYRNIIERDGARLPHILDPLQGRPVGDGLASVSVVHESAMWADGYATLIMALGKERGLAFAAERQLPAYLLMRTQAGLRGEATAPMQALLAPRGPT